MFPCPSIPFSFIIQVAEKLMIMHEECLEGNFRSIDLLREAAINRAAHPDVTQVYYSEIGLEWDFINSQ